MGDALNQLIDSLKARVVHVTKEAFAKSVETVDAVNNKSFVKNVFWRAVRAVMTTMLEDNGARDALESAVIRAETSGPMAQAVSNMVVEKKKLMAPVAISVAK